MTRVLFGLSILQLAILTFLAVKQVDAEARLAALQSTAGSASNSAQPAAYADAPGTLNASELRRIVREEVAAISKPSRSERNAAAAPSRAVASTATEAMTTGASSQRIRLQLSGYVSRGKMTPAEMDEFIATAAELPTEQRRQVMRELTNAMNSGRLDARM